MRKNRQALAILGMPAGDFKGLIALSHGCLLGFAGSGWRHQLSLVAATAVHESLATEAGATSTIVAAPLGHESTVVVEAHYTHRDAPAPATQCKVLEALALVTAKAPGRAANKGSAGAPETLIEAIAIAL